MSHNDFHEKLFENLISKEEIAVALGKSPRTIANWMSSKYQGFPTTSVGNTNMVLRSDFNDWLIKLSKKRTKKCYLR